MTGQFIYSLHIQKLGHHLEEIRVRALHSILSKLNCGFVQDRELASRPELMRKLLEWFSFDVVSEEENVLELIFRILKADEGDSLMLLKMPDMTKMLDGIREKLHGSKSLGLLERIREMVPSDSQCVDSTRAGSCRTSDGGSESGRTATTLELFARGSEGDQPCEASGDPSSAYQHGFFLLPGGTPSNQLRACFPWLWLPWQPLCPTDQHVVAAVEESLVRAPKQACQFFCHVMLQDFPAEVFLQRPRIVKTLLALLEPNKEKSTQHLHSLVVKCLHDLTKNLCVRVEYCADPCTHSLKQDQNGSSVSTPASLSARLDGCGEGQPMAGQYLQNCDLGQPSPRPAPSDGEDQLVLQLRQLGLPQFCLLVLERALPLLSTARAFPLVWCVVSLLPSCTTAALWLSTDPVAQEVSQLVKNVFSSLGDALEHCRHGCRLTYLQLLSVVPRLMSCTVLPDLADVAVPSKLRLVLADSLFDYPLLALFPRLHAELLAHAQIFSDPKTQERLRLHSDATQLCGSLKTAVQFLKNAGELSGQEFLSVVDDALVSIPVHRNMNAVKHAVDICFTKFHSVQPDDKVWKRLSDVLLKMLAYADQCVRLEAYKACHGHVVAALGVDHMHHQQTASHVVLLFDTPLLVEVVCHGTPSPTKRIQQYAEEILIHLLKGKFLMSDQMWRKFVESLIPTLPLLLCCASKAFVLGCVITKMLDPDISSTIFLPNFVVLKGNLCLLMSDQPSVREEASSRLVWLLMRQPRSRLLLPDLSSLSSSELGSMLLVDKQHNVFHARVPQVFYEAGNLCQVLELLESSFVEPVVRRSALTQISVMLDDPRLHSTFIEHKGVDLVLKIFHAALVKKDFANCPEFVIPIVSILRSLAHHNSTLRQELALQESVFYCIVRAGLMFGDSQQHRVAVAHLLCLLLYSDYLLPAPAGEQRGAHSLPQLVVQKMALPFNSRSHWCFSPHTQPSYASDVAREEKVRRLLSHCWSAEWFGGVAALLGWTSVQGVPDCSEELRVSPADLAALKQSAVALVCEDSLRAIRSAASHQHVYRLLHVLTGYTWLQIAVGGGEEYWDALPWEETFRRFLTTRPACPEDDELLAAVLDFLRLQLRVVPAPAATGVGAEESWLARGLQAPDGPLLGLLDEVGGGVEGERSKELCRAALQLCTDCGAQGWVTVAQAVSRCLHCSDSQHFYNLALLSWMLSCLMHVTSCHGWSGGTQVEWLELAAGLCGLVAAFHCGSNAGSFMGLAITRSAVLCMNHLLAEMQGCAEGKWVELWQLTLGESYQLWMPSLWQCRDPVVRAAALQLLAGLCVSPTICASILTSFDLVSMALSFVVDHREASLVREHAAALLTIIVSHVTRTTSSPSGEVLQEPLQDLRRILEKYDFYQELGTIFSRLYVAEKLVPCDSFLGRWRLESLSGHKLSPRDGCLGHQVVLVCETAPGQVNSSSKPVSEASGSELNDVHPSTVVSPSFVAACCWLLVNLLAVDEMRTVASLVEHGIIEVLFGCLGGASVPAERAASLHADLVDMRSAACCALCKCVAASATCRAAVLHMPACLRTLLLLVHPVDYRTDGEQMVLLRDRLWSEVFRLLTALLVPDDRGPDGFKAMCSALHQSGHAPFLEAVKLSLTDGSSPDLQDSSLVSLTSLLAPEVTSVAATRRDDAEAVVRDAAGPFSVQSLLDNCCGVREDPNTSPVAGAELCEVLLRLFHAHVQRRSEHGSLGRGAVVGALSSLLAVSHAAKHHALQRGLHAALVAHARDLQLSLGLDSARCLRKLTHRRRICPVLDDLRAVLGVLTNFMVGSSGVKTAVAQAGLVDVVHKAWVWCTAVPTFMTETLQLLCTLTTNCLPGSQSLVLTTTVPGVGPRKTASAASLLHVMVALVQRELDLVGHSHDQHVLALVFQLLRNSTHSHECRVVLAKGGLLQAFLLLHPAHTKGHKCWDSVESLWLQFLADFTFHPEAQLALPKVPDCLELLLSMANCARRSTRLLSLVVLRNVAFHQLNRPRLLASLELLRVLGRALVEGEAEEKSLAAATLWALVANNQKAKLVVKCSGFTSKLQAALDQLGAARARGDVVQVLEYVLRLLQPDRR